MPSATRSGTARLSKVASRLQPRISCMARRRLPSKHSSKKWCVVARLLVVLDCILPVSEMLNLRLQLVDFPRLTSRRRFSLIPSRASAASPRCISAAAAITARNANASRCRDRPPNRKRRRALLPRQPLRRTRATSGIWHYRSSAKRALARRSSMQSTENCAFVRFDG